MKSDEKKYRKYLSDLTDYVGKFCIAVDNQMKLPSTVERGRMVAKLVNGLEFANDQARHFGLGIDFDIGCKKPAEPK